jgi:hypothetical protein
MSEDRTFSTKALKKFRDYMWDAWAISFDCDEDAVGCMQRISSIIDPTATKKKAQHPQNAQLKR